jgi:hypothetical protein
LRCFRLGFRQIEIGLASMTSLLWGLTTAIVVVAGLIARLLPKWIGALAIAGGVPTAIAGVVIAKAGFFELAMLINMPASSLLMFWMIALRVSDWRRSVQ